MPDFLKGWWFGLWGGLVTLLIFSLIGCGPQQTQVAPNIYTDSTFEEYLITIFYDTKEEGNFYEGEYEDLIIIIMQPVFPCEWYESGCTGEFVFPNVIKIGNYKIWRHEVIHFLLSVNIGDADPNHNSLLFNS